jgi:hypothetical protein
VIKPGTFDPRNVPNMLAIVLDPHFKSLQIVESYVGLGATIHLAFEYDTKTRIPLLMASFDQLNPTCQDVQLLLMCSILNLKKKKKVICLVLEHPWRNPLVLLLLGNFYLFKRLFILAFACANPLF